MRILTVSKGCVAVTAPHAAMPPAMKALWEAGRATLARAAAATAATAATGCRPGSGHGEGRGSSREEVGCARAHSECAGGTRGGGGVNKVAAYPAVVDISCFFLSPCLRLVLCLELGRLDTVRRRRTSSGSSRLAVAAPGPGQLLFLAGGFARASSDVGQRRGGRSRHLRQRRWVGKQPPTDGKCGGDVVGGRGWIGGMRYEVRRASSWCGWEQRRGFRAGRDGWMPNYLLYNAEQ